MRVAGKHRQYAEEGETHELMSESYSRRSWKGIAIAFLVLGAVAAIIALIVIFSGPRPSMQTDGTLKLDDVINNVYSPKGFGNVKWVDEIIFWFTNTSNNIFSYDCSKNTTSVLVANTTLEPNMASFFPSPSGKYIIYSYNQNKHFRYSSNASYTVMDINTKSTFKIHDGELLQLASWSSKDQLVYVYQNNIYYLADVSQPNKSVPVTSDGKEGVIVNGIPDWVYEEEILGSASALWWSPDGNNLAFMKFDDTAVNDMYFIEYGNYKQPYTSVVDIKYPKPGYPNPKVSVWLFKPSDPVENATEIKGLDYYHYITAITWANNSVLCAVGGPRVQNLSVVSLCFKDDNWACKNDSEERSPDGWVDAKTPLFSDDGTKYFLIKSNNNFKHLYMKDVPSNEDFLTSGEYEVTSIIKYDSTNKIIYYIRTDDKGPEKRRFYKIDLSNGTKNQVCLSCDQDNCNWASANIGPNSKYYALTCSSKKFNNIMPIVKIFQLPGNTLVRVWEDNQELQKKLEKQTLTNFLTYDIQQSNGFSIKISVTVPLDFNKNVRYPALINVYGGPGSQMITDNFAIDFGTYLTSVHKILYIEVDGRGSAYRGDELLFQLYKRLGTVEIEDQIAAMRYLLRNETFVDPKRVAIWGWSYGGYAAAMTLAKGGPTFQCAMSVAPVTSWTYYDSVYTERYMLQPADNSDSYKNSALMEYASNFKSKKFLLLHGTADDNVHLQQSMMLITALHNASIHFELGLYPNENHGIPKSKLHVYETLRDFILECFA